MHPPPPDVRSLFGRALEIESAAERAAFLDEACGGNAELRAEVESLLQAIDNAGSFMKQPAAPAPDPRPTVDPPPVAERPGTVIGPYKLIEPIGEGGMGSVWMAQQTEPVKRLVAVKLIKAGMDSQQVVARFEAERQALALMDHPNIARVLDGGTTSAGRPYFVMDLVKGVPITRYCDQHHLTPPSAWSCSSRSARRSSMRTRRGSSTATSSPPTCSSPSTTASRCPRSSTSAWPRRPGNP
jgi:serine/threonine protein kinase